MKKHSYLTCRICITVVAFILTLPSILRSLDGTRKAPSMLAEAISIQVAAV